MPTISNDKISKNIYIIIMTNMTCSITKMLLQIGMTVDYYFIFTPSLVAPSEKKKMMIISS